MISYGSSGPYTNPVASYFPQTQLYYGIIQEQRDPSDVFEMILLRECERNSRKCSSQPPTVAGFNSYNFMRASSTLAIVTKAAGEKTGINQMVGDPETPEEEKIEEHSLQKAVQPIEVKPPIRTFESVRKEIDKNVSSPISSERANLLFGMQSLDSELRSVDEEENHIKGVNESI